jgi:hypothetical protein
MGKISKVAVSAVAVATAFVGFAGVAQAKSSAVPAGTGTWDSNSCTATFVRSASGIVNETNRTCSPVQNQWTSLNVYLQFRPIGGTPNSTCDQSGLVTAPFPYLGGSDSTLSNWFVGGQVYNVCVYPVPDQVVSSDFVDSASQTGSAATLATTNPGAVIPGQYRIDVTGTWKNLSHGAVDAQYNNGDDPTFSNWTFNQAGWPGLGAEWGRLLVNGQAVNWGTFNPNHAYSWSTASGTSSIQLNVFDGIADDSVVPPTLAPNPDWYSDNQGSLSYTITYLGQ